MLVAVASTKGSPGATTLAVMLAAVWPDERALVVEADCAGGDLGGRCWLPDTPGLASLVTGLRSRGTELEAHVTRLPCGVDAILAPAGRHPATVATGLLMESGLNWAGRRPIIADVGRLDPGTPGTALAESADAVVVCSRGDEASLLHLTDAGLPRATSSVVLVGGSGYSGPEVTAAVGLPVLADLPWDARAADMIWGRRRPGSGWTRRGLPAAVRALALRLAERRGAAAGVQASAPARLAATATARGQVAGPADGRAGDGTCAPVGDGLAGDPVAAARWRSAQVGADRDR